MGKFWGKKNNTRNNVNLHINYLNSRVLNTRRLRYLNVINAFDVFWFRGFDALLL